MNKNGEIVNLLNRVIALVEITELSDLELNLSVASEIKNNRIQNLEGLVETFLFNEPKLLELILEKDDLNNLINGVSKIRQITGCHLKIAKAIYQAYHNKDSNEK